MPETILIIPNFRLVLFLIFVYSSNQGGDANAITPKASAQRAWHLASLAS